MDGRKERTNEERWRGGGEVWWSVEEEGRREMVEEKGRGEGSRVEVELGRVGNGRRRKVDWMGVGVTMCVAEEEGGKPWKPHRYQPAKVKRKSSRQTCSTKSLTLDTLPPMFKEHISHAVDE